MATAARKLSAARRVDPPRSASPERAGGRQTVLVLPRRIEIDQTPRDSIARNRRLGGLVVAQLELGPAQLE
jgi:hypothetical protein